MAQLAISNVIEVSVSQANLGVNAFNTSNLAIFSNEIPAETFGTAGFKQYVEPTSVATDFGTSSKTAQMATAVFGQQPNILAGNGQLIVILMTPSTQQIALSGVPASGAFTISWGSNTTTSLPFTATAAQIQTALQLLPGLAGVVVTGSLASETLTVQMSGVYGPTPALFTFPANTLETSGSSAITLTPTISVAGQTITAALNASISLVQFFGMMVTDTITHIGSTDVNATAAVVQSLTKIAFWVSTQVADIQAGGIITGFQTASDNQNRGLYYGDTSVVSGYAGLNALLMMAAYAGSALSVNFQGSNTTTTENLKTLKTINPDPSMNQTIFNEAATAGADIYVSYQGDPSVVSNGANQFFDDVYNLLSFTAAIQVAGYNYLAQTSTKIPQTENGMNGFKGALRNVCQQYVVNQFIAPGSWTSPTTFGNQTLFFANIIQLGYYIYSQPIAQQAQTARAARQAPLVQIAIKFAGAIQTADITIFVNQ